MVEKGQKKVLRISDYKKLTNILDYYHIKKHKHIFNIGLLKTRTKFLGMVFSGNLTNVKNNLT